MSSNPALADATTGALIDNAAYLNQVATLANALHENGISGSFAVAQASANLVAHTLGYNYNPLFPKSAQKPAALAWSNAAAALGDLATLTAGGPGSLVKTLQDTEAGIDLVRLASTGDFATALGPIAGIVGDVAGIIQGFETGGVEGSTQAGFSAEMLALLLRDGIGASNFVGIAVAVLALVLGGNHENPATMPDKFDTQRYGQGVADLQGTAGASGQAFSESPALYQLFAGRTAYKLLKKS